MGATLANLVVKHNNVNDIKEFIKQDKPSDFQQSVYVSDVINGYIAVFPPIESFEFVGPLARTLSEEFKTVALAGYVYDSDDIMLGVANNGEVIYVYGFNKTKHNMKSADTTGTLKSILDAFNIPLEKEPELENIIKSSYVFAEDQYGKILEFLGLPYFLRSYSYRYIFDMVNKFENGIEEFSNDPEGFTIFEV